MLGFGLGEVVILFFAIAICLGLVIAWMLKSETSRTAYRSELKKLKAHLDNAGREKALLLEEMQNLQDNTAASESADASAAGGEGPKKTGPSTMVLKKMVEKNESLEKEIAALKKELGEAKSSLEEVYKALVQ